MDANYNNYMVAIRCMTFNHKPYIQQCLDGFVIQETNFPFVAIVMDDSSTDNEQGVLWDFINNELDSISLQKDETDDFVRVVAPHKSNNKCTFVFIFLKYNHYSIKKTKIPYFKEWEEGTKYMAICEGDDYWIDPLKLQKQVDFLESHADYGMVYTNYKLFNQENGETTFSNCIQASFEDEIILNWVATLTILVKTTLWYQYSQEIGNTPSERNWLMGDYPTWIYIMANSKAKLIPDFTAVYRVLKNSASHHTSYKKNKDFLLSTYDIRFYYSDKYNVPAKIRKTIANNEINDLLYLTKKHNSNLHFPLLMFMLRNKIFDIKKYISAQLRSSVWGRKIYNYIKAI